MQQGPGRRQQFLRHRRVGDVAAVSGSSRLSVDAGLTTTPAGQVEVAPASPANAVVVTTTSLSPCTSTVASAFAPVGTDFGSVDQVYPSGIPVPAGDALGLEAGVNDGGLATIYGYLVPAAVPASALRNVAPADLARIKPRP